MTVEPLMDTWPSETGIVATVVSSAVFLMMKLPVPAATVSEKLRTILESMATAVASSAGVDELRVGAVVSACPGPATLKIAGPLTVTSKAPKSARSYDVATK